MLSSNVFAHVVIAPQVMGGELTAMLLSGEQITPEFVMQQVFQQTTTEPPSAPRGKKS
ncbi:hypothetical protein [Tunturiibacter gelidiferens]|uniref:hypothetical protein n=1 Tax=Tunturiibacter gelidiferens TaxID=3069689 RepID=UPI003D9B61E1